MQRRTRLALLMAAAGVQPLAPQPAGAGGLVLVALALAPLGARERSERVGAKRRTGSGRPWRTLCKAAALVVLLIPCGWIACAVIYAGLPVWLAWGWLGFDRMTEAERERGEREAAEVERWIRLELQRRRMLDTAGNRAAVVMANRGARRHG